MVDLIIIGIILLFTFLGYKRGLVKLALGLLTFFIAIAIAFTIYKPVANFLIEKTGLDDAIRSAVTAKILPEGMTDTSEVDLSQSLPKVLLQGSSNTVASIATSISRTLIETVCLLVVFIIAKIVLKFITLLADLIAKLPILKQFNELGGTIYGVLEGIFIVLVALAVISLVAPLIDTSILEYINKSIIGSFIYNNNILLKFII